MTLRIRARRDTLVSGAFDYATLDDAGTLLQSGIGHLSGSPVAGVCELILPADLVLLDEVSAPAPQRARLSNALRFLAEERTIPEPDSLHVAAGPGGERGILPIAIIDREWLSQLIARLKGSALIPQYAFPELLLVPLPPGAWVVIWDGIESFVRTGPSQGFALDEPQGHEPPIALRLALQRAREQGQTPARIIVRPAPAAGALPDAEEWSRALGIAVETGVAWQWSQYADKPEIDLLQGDFAAGDHEQGWRSALRRVAALAALVVLAASAGLAADWIAKARERRALLAEMQTIYRETFGEQAVIVDPPLQMARALDQLRGRAGLSGPSDFLSLLSAASDAAAGLERQRIEAMAYEKGKLTLSFRGADATKMSAVLTQLRAKGTPTGVQFGMETSGTHTMLTITPALGP